MKVTQQYLKQVIKEEVEKMQESGELDEGAMDFLRSLGGQAKQAAQTKAGEVAAAAKQKFQQAAEPVKAAVKTAKQASAAADVKTVAAKAEQTVGMAQKSLDILLDRLEKLGMAKQAGLVSNAIKQLESISLTLNKLAS
jgi:hypothetical protein